jgi:hypothetical protein
MGLHRRRELPVKYLLLLLAACGPFTYSLEDRVLLEPDACVGSTLGLQVLQYAADAWNAQGAHFIVDDGHLTAEGLVAYDYVLPVQCDDHLYSYPNSEILGQYQVNPVGGNRIVFDQGIWQGMGMWTAKDDGWVPYTYKSLAMHEMGHALGCRHILGKNVMYWVVQGINTVNVSANDVEPGLQAEDLADLRCAQTGEGCGSVQYDPNH